MENMGFDGKILRIIGNPTKDKLYLQGATGYNNGVKTLDKICDELYSNKKTGVSVTNLKRSDIQKVSTYDYTNYKHQKNEWEEDMSNDDVNTVHFGESIQYDVVHCPDMWMLNDRKWTYSYNAGKKTGEVGDCILWERLECDDGEFSDSGENEGKMDLKECYYCHRYNQEEFMDTKYFDMIFKDSKRESFTGILAWNTNH